MPPDNVYERPIWIVDMSMVYAASLSPSSRALRPSGVAARQTMTAPRESAASRGPSTRILALLRREPRVMGTATGVLHERAHTRTAGGAVLDNRLRLKAAMEAHGWRNYSKEWWHYTSTVDPRPAPRDVPCSCFEPEEGAWSPPEGWDEPGYTMPLTWSPTPCD